MEKIAAYFRGDDYGQHNPQIPDGLTGLGAALKVMAEQGFALKYDRIDRLLGEGNFALAVSEGNFGGRHSAFYDLFRMENGKVAEHWEHYRNHPAPRRMEERQRQILSVTPFTVHLINRQNRHETICTSCSRVIVAIDGGIRSPGSRKRLWGRY
jgi:predicted SnoaL-like aldol condensation-catalyzing enzyme